MNRLSPGDLLLARDLRISQPLRRLELRGVRIWVVLCALARLLLSLLIALPKDGHRWLGEAVWRSESLDETCVACRDDTGRDRATGHGDREIEVEEGKLILAALLEGTSQTNIEGLRRLPGSPTGDVQAHG